MLTTEGPRVVEFNCRFGDPETQVVLPMMASSLLELLVAVADGGRLSGRPVRWRGGAALTTVLASGGYPGPYEKGEEIRIGEEAAESDDTVVFHAGTSRPAGGEGLVTSGGRVLACTGLGDTLESAAAASLAAARAIEFEGRQFRTDIGWRELQRQREGNRA
jgi:phosphoribosylamine--glycine ligase